MIIHNEIASGLNTLFASRVLKQYVHGNREPISSNVRLKMMMTVNVSTSVIKEVVRSFWRKGKKKFNRIYRLFLTGK